MNNINYKIRQKCAINDANLEILSKDTFPLFCGCVEDTIENDYICE